MVSASGLLDRWTISGLWPLSKPVLGQIALDMHPKLSLFVVLALQTERAGSEQGLDLSEQLCPMALVNVERCKIVRSVRL